MKSIRKITGIFMAAIAIMALSGTAGFAKIAPQGAFSNADLIVLSLNHARTIAFDLDTTVGGPGGLHSIYIATYGKGTLTLSFSNHAALTKGDEMIFFVAGFAGTSPVLNYAYSSATIAFNIAVPDVAVGVIFTGILYTTGGPDFPVTMSVTAILN